MSYQEEQKSFIIIIAVGVFTFFVLPFDISKILANPTNPFWVLILLIVLEVFFIFAFVNFYKLKIEINDEYLEFGFGLIKTRFQRQDIISCEPYRLRFGNYLGIGIRIGFNRTIAFNTRFGKGVRIQIKDKKRAYVLTSNDPRALCEALRNKTEEI